MVMSMMPPVHEEMHQRASEDEQERRYRGQMGAMPDDQINRAQRDKAKQEKPFGLVKQRNISDPPVAARRGLLQMR